MSDDGTFTLRIRPRWRRVLRAPRIWHEHYRIVRRHSGRVRAALLAARFVWWIVRA